MLPHLDAAYNLARWLTRDAASAEDVVQEAMLRALTYFASFKGVNPRAWLLQIVRNAAYASHRVDQGVRLLPIGAPGEAGAVELGLDQQHLVALRHGGHGSLASAAAWLKSRRARKSRDITVPIGVRVISAISL